MKKKYLSIEERIQRFHGDLDVFIAKFIQEKFSREDGRTLKDFSLLEFIGWFSNLKDKNQ